MTNLGILISCQTSRDNIVITLMFCVRNKDFMFADLCDIKLLKE